MFHPTNLTCNLCFFTAANHEQWGNHIVNNHSNIFLPLFPSYESFQDPHLQFQPFQQLQPFSLRPPFAVEVDQKNDLYPGQHQHDEKENKVGGHILKQEFLSNQAERSTYAIRPELAQLIQTPQATYSHNPYQPPLNQFHKCPYCQYLGSTPELLQNHIQSEHTYQDKVYSDLKPVAMGYAGDSTQLINLVHQDPQQQLTVRGNSPPQAAGQTVIIVPSNFINEQRSPNVAHTSSLEITPSQFVLDKSPKIPEIVPVTAQVSADQTPMTKVGLIAVNLNKTDDDGGITGIVVEKPPLKQSDKRNASGKHLKCEFCDKEFKRRDHMTKHIKAVHTTERNFECTVCFKKYSSEGTLKQHVQNSHSQKLQQCQFCEKAFARKDHLTKHVQGVHLKERKFICQHCNKSYTSQGALLQHVGKAHLEKNFTCPKCNRKFATNIRLQIHMQETSLMSNPFPCEVCGERFLTSSLMLEHSVKSHKMKAWKCEICNGNFKGKYILQAHIKKMHKPIV